jgi:hypothetical protein
VDGKLLLSGTTSVVIDTCADGQQRFVRAVNGLSEEKITEKSLANAILHPASCEPDLVVIFGDPTQLPAIVGVGTCLQRTCVSEYALAKLQH